MASALLKFTGNRDGADVAADRQRTLVAEAGRTMYFRIDRLEIGEDRLIVISGRVAAQNLDVLRAVLAEERGIVAIDLSGVNLIDRDTVKFLAAAEADGIELRNCPAYIRDWVARERAQMNSD